MPNSAKCQKEANTSRGLSCKLVFKKLLENCTIALNESFRFVTF